MDSGFVEEIKQVIFREIEKSNEISNISFAKLSNNLDSIDFYDESILDEIEERLICAGIGFDLTMNICDVLKSKYNFTKTGTGVKLNKNQLLNIAESLLDYSSPRSALKRIIKNLKD